MLRKWLCLDAYRYLIQASRGLRLSSVAIATEIALTGQGYTNFAATASLLLDLGSRIGEGRAKAIQCGHLPPSLLAG